MGAGRESGERWVDEVEMWRMFIFFGHSLVVMGKKVNFVAV